MSALLWSRHLTMSLYKSMSDSAGVSTSTYLVMCKCLYLRCNYTIFFGVQVVLTMFWCRMRVWSGFRIPIFAPKLTCGTFLCSSCPLSVMCSISALKCLVQRKKAYAPITTSKCERVSCLSQKLHCVFVFIPSKKQRVAEIVTTHPRPRQYLFA